MPTPEKQGLNNIPLPPRVRVRGKNKVCGYINDDEGLIQMITPVMSNWYTGILYISRPAVESLSFQKISTSYHTTSSSNLLLMLEIQIGFLAGLDLIHQEGHHNPLERTYGFRSIQVLPWERRMDF
jgi:hypothetical protein